MTGKKLTHTLLSACAVLLALNLVRGEPWAVGQVAQVGPAMPSVVAAGVHQVIYTTGVGHRATRVYRVWSDGSIDETLVEHSSVSSCNVTDVCGPLTILPATCTTADLDHNAQVDISDLLGLLAFWGPCE